jgi:hypothetical protein
MSMGNNRNKERCCNGVFALDSQKYYFKATVNAVSYAQAKYYCAGQIQKDFNTKQFIDITEFNEMTLSSSMNHMRDAYRKFKYIPYEKILESRRKFKETEKLVLEVFPPDKYEILSFGTGHIKIKATDSNYTRSETTRGEHIYMIGF